MRSEIIKGKNVYIVEEHHHVLKAWERYKGANVITFDYHTDTLGAFNSYSGKQVIYDRTKNQKIICHELLQQYLDGGKISDSIAKLKNDEHISFAVEAKLISFAFVCSQKTPSSYPLFPSNYEINYYASTQNHNGKEYPYSGQRIIECSVRCAPLDDPKSGSILKNENFDLVLDDSVLYPIFKNFRRFVDPFASPHLTPYFILDFDMDYFSTRKSLKPQQRQMISELIKQSCAITIATEDACSEMEWEDDTDIDCKENLNSLLSLIDEALSCA